MKLQGRRGVISIHEDNGVRIATKTAKHPSNKGSINKEAQLLTFLKKKGISFVPQLIESGDGWFSYPWIEGEHLKHVYARNTLEQQRILVLALLRKAHVLDTVGVVHGEFIRPFTNMLVNEENELFIIDFERGTLGDTSGKNMRSLSQWLLAERRISLEDCKYIGALPREEMYKYLCNNVQNSSKKTSNKTLYGILVISLISALLILIDQISKYLFYDLQRGKDVSFVTPLLNTGVGRSLPVPLAIVMVITGLAIGGVLALYKKQYLHLWPATLILAGAIGNGIDRVIYQGVRDFIDISQILFTRPVFNVADIFLSVAVLILFYGSYIDINQN